MRKQILLNPAKIFIILVLSIIPGLVATAGISHPAAGAMLSTYTVDAWAEPSVNPIFDPDEKAYYPSVLFDGTTYRMWYGSSSNVWYSESSDGISWIPGTPVNGLKSANHPHVEYCGGKYLIWYWDTSQLYSNSAIRYAESLDGISWTNDQTITGGLITGGVDDWNRGSYGSVDVIYNESATNQGTNPFDYSYAMYFDGTTGNFEEIGLGYSQDGIDWTYYGKVFIRGNNGPWGNTDDWDSSYVTFASVMRESEGVWHMWYSGGQVDTNNGIGHAYSADGLTWTRDTANPIIHASDGVSWRNVRTYTPSVIKVNGVYRMWFSGKDEADNYAIGCIQSTGAFSTIQSAIDAASAGDTVSVAAGTYNESIIIDKSILLEGADAATTVISGTAATAVTIGSDGVTISGFTITNPSGKHGILSTDNSNISINNNIITDVGSSDGSASGTNFGIGIVCSSEAVNTITIIGNQINGIAGGTDKSADGIAVGWSNGSYDVTNLIIQNNVISGITADGTNPWGSGGSGAYGIIINHAGTSAGGSTVSPQVLDNTISNLAGLWSHGIGLEGDTPGALVQGNSISDLSSTKPGFDPPDWNDAVAVMVEENNSAGTVTITGNDFSGLAYGVTNRNSTGVVNAVGNWWGNASGPYNAISNPGGTGAAVDDGVHYSGWTGDVSSTSPMTFYVNSSHTGAIQDTIDATAAGDTIYVAAGTYAECLIIEKPLTLRGATYDVNKNGYGVPDGYAWDDTVESIIVQPSTIPYPNSNGGYVALVDIRDTDDVTFEGFIIQELNADGNRDDSLVRVYAHTMEISNITVRNNVIGPFTNTISQDGTHGRMGLYLANHPYSDQYGIVNSTFSGNKIFGCEGNGNNVFVWSSYKNPAYGAEGPASMSGTVIEDNEISGSHRSGIETAGGFSGLTINNNDIFGNYKLENDPLNCPLKYGNGIVMIRGSSDKTDSGGYGPMNVTIENNDIYDNDGHGIYMGPVNKGIIISDNKLYNNGQDAVVIDLEGQYWNPTFEDEPDPWNEHAAYDQSQNIVVGNNEIYNNTRYGARVIGTPTNSFKLDAAENWWGSGDKDTILTFISGDIEYDPWYTDETKTTTGSDKPVHNETQGTFFDTVQAAIDAASNGDTITVATGQYAGAIVNKSVILVGADDGSSEIISGVPFKENSSAYATAFRLDADGCEIRNFTINCDIALDLDLAVYAIEIDNVTIDSLTINDNGTVQGITNWGGSNWVITNNVVTSTVVSSGGGIGIFLGAKAGQQCTGNLVEGNEINATATAETFSCPGIFLGLDTRYGEYDLLDGTEDISGNQILNNTITSSGVNNGIGIEVGVILGDTEEDSDRGDPDKIAALMTAAAVHDNTVRGNSVNGAKTGLYLYNVTGLTIEQNYITNSVANAVYSEYGLNDIVIVRNSFVGNIGGIKNDSDSKLLATRNWWGTADGDEIDLMITGKVAYDPYYDSETMDNLVYDNPVRNQTQDIGYETIQEAIDEAETGDTITIEVGTYTENPESSIPLSITGVATDGELPVLEGTLLLNAGADGTNIENLDFLVPAGITDTFDSVSLHGVSDVSITHCSFDGNGTFIINEVKGARGVQMNSGCSDITISNCTFTNGYYLAIQGYPNGLTVQDTSVTDCKSGINQQGGGDLVVTDTDISVVAQANGSDTYCVRFASESGVATDMSINGGVLTVDKNDTTADEGIYHHAVVIRAAAEGTLEIEKTKIYGDVINLSTVPLTASYNWWGTADSTEIEARINDTVSYDPYYTTEAMDTFVTDEPVYNQTQNKAYGTIQAAIDDADEGDTITVAAGTYQENLVVDKCVSVIGTLDGTAIATFITPVTDTPVVSVTTSGISSDEPILLQNLHIHTSDQDASDTGKMTGIRVVSPDDPVAYIRLDNVTVIGCHHAYPGLESGFALSPDTSLSDVTITNCLFQDLSYGIASIGISSDNPGYFRNVSISDTILEKNSVKGLYTERLSDAAFTNVTVVDNGNADLAPTWADPWNAGIDINLKFGDYQNITLTNLTVLRNGIGHEKGTGLTIKARGTGNDPSYASNQATLDGVTINGGTFNENVMAIRFGDPGTDNEWPKNITITNVTILKNNTSGGLINNLSGVTINAINNYWDSPDGPVHNSNTYNIDSQGSSVTGSVSYVPWLDSANGASFAPITNGAGSYASIQSAINAAASVGDILVVGSGTYTESVGIDRSLSLIAPEGAEKTKIIGTSWYVIDIMSGNDITVDGFDIDRIEARGISMAGISEGTTVTIQNCHIHDNDIGIYAGQVYGTLNIFDNVIEDNEIRGIHLAGIEAPETVNILRNDIRDNRDGIYLDDIGNSAINIRENSITNNECGLVFGSTGSFEAVLDISGNHFSDNALGIENTGEETVVAENNFWGTVDEDTIAARVSGNVDYDPWHLKDAIVLSEVPVTQITTDSLILNWTAQNTLDGDYYDFRYSTSPINNATKWAKATRITGEPEPADADQSMIIRGLQSDTDYYFVLKVIYNGVSSEELNIDTVTASTVVPDTTNPSAIDDLAAATGDPGTTSIILTWGATGDDGDEGFASKYIVKRSTTEITEDTFNAAITVYQNIKPKKSGEQETLDVNKLQSGTVYYFMVQAVDEAGNPAFSNSISFTTENNLPTVTAVSPDTGDNGQNRTISITGTNFIQSGSTVVRLVSDDNSFKLSNVRYVDSTGLTAKVPKGVPAGEYRIRVINSNGTSKLSTVTYTVTEAPVPLPVVTNVSPNLASSNTPLTGIKINGKNLSGATSVAVDGTTATSITVVSDTQIIVDIPGLSAGEYDVKVTTPSGENSVSAVKLIVTDPVVIDADSTEDAVTSDVVDLDTNVTPVQITLTTDDSETATKNTDSDAEISVVIPPNTTLTDDNGDAYTGTINPPRVVKPDETIQEDLPEEAVVIEMGNPDETITFNQEFVATVAVSSTAEPDIYYYNKTTDTYELAGKTGSLDGVDYVPGGVVLAEEPINGETVYTIGLLLDHMSTYVASSENLIQEDPEEPEEPTTTEPTVNYLPPSTPELPPGTTDLTDTLSSTGQFLSAVSINSQDNRIVLVIPEGTIGLDASQNPLTEITMNESDAVAAQLEDGLILGPIYDLGPEGAVFDPGIQLQWNYDPDDLPEGISEGDLAIAWYDEEASEWCCCECTCDPDEHCVKGCIYHFSQFTLIASLPEDTEEPEVVIEPVIPEEPEDTGEPEVSIEPEESEEERDIPTLGTIIETDDEEEPEADEAPDIGDDGMRWYWWVIAGIVVTSVVVAVIWEKRRYWITG